jgi:hypothetical protein
MYVDPLVYRYPPIRFPLYFVSKTALFLWLQLPATQGAQKVWTLIRTYLRDLAPKVEFAAETVAKHVQNVYQGRTPLHGE